MVLKLGAFLTVYAGNTEVIANNEHQKSPTPYISPYLSVVATTTSPNGLPHENDIVSSKMDTVQDTINQWRTVDVVGSVR